MIHIPNGAVFLFISMAYGSFSPLTEELTSFFLFSSIAHKVLAIELTQFLFAEPARQGNREIRTLETRSGY